LAQTVTASLELPEVLDSVARAARDLLRDSASRIWVVEDDRLILRSEAGTLGLHRPARKSEFAFGEGLTGHAALTREPLVVEDVVADPRSVNVEWMHQEGYVSFVGIPLVIRNRVVGVLSLLTRHPHRFTAGELETLSAFGAQAAIAVENARLYEAVREARDFLQSIAENSADAIITTDVGGRVTYFSPGAVEMFGLEARSVLGRPIADYYRSGLEEARAVMAQLRTEGRIKDYETAFRARDGRLVEVSSSISLLRDAKGEIVGTVGIVKDITERKRAEALLRQNEERLKELSFRDEITGLYNRRFFSVRLEEELARYRRFAHPVSVVLMDVDDFKAINDELGHADGDETLREIGQIFLTHSRGINAIARYGGDEFAVLLVETAKPGAWAYADRLRQAIFAFPFSHGRRITASFGIASVPEDAAPSSDALVRAADAALYAAKRAGKNTVVGHASNGAQAGKH
jgi:diguanylate cyclase (GGDEF)-like protein/PAS domain S-box-containing protein